MCNNNSINSDEKSSVLIDKTKSGKIRTWREKKMANVDYFELLNILEVIKQKQTVRWLFLTLTVRNVYDGTELNKSLSDMSKGFNRMMKYKKINKNLVGFMRATEVTVNNIDNSYNQHMHVLVCVESTY